MATVIDRLVVELGLDPKAFTKGQREAAAALLKTRQEAEKESQKIEKAIDSATAAVDRLARNALKLFAIFTAGRAIKDFVADVTGADAALGRLATRIGQAPGEISAMASAVNRIGGSFDAAANSFQAFSDNIQQIRTTGDSSILPFLARVQAAGGKTINLNKDISETFIDLADNLKVIRDRSGDAQANYLGRQLGLDEGTVALLVRGGAAVRAYLEQSRRLGVATKADTEAAQNLQTTWRGLTQASEGLGRTILTALTPTIVDLLKRMQAWIEKNGEWLRTNIVESVQKFADVLKSIDWASIAAGVKAFVEGANWAAQAVGGWSNAAQILFGLWLGSKFIRVLANIALIRAALLGGRGGLLAGGLGGLFGALAIGSAVAADRSLGATEKRDLSNHNDDQASGAAPGGMWGAVGRAWNWGKRKLGFGGGGESGAAGAPAGGGGRVGALPIAPGTGEGHVASREERANYIRQAAIRNGIDPEVALRVAQSEGFDKYTGDQGRSFGDWQLFTGGGLGNEAEKAGINVRDPSTWKEQTDFALRKAREGGWGPWNGAKRVGIGNWQGIDRNGDAGASGDVTRGSANHMQGQYGPAGSNLTTITTASGRKVTVHAAAAASFKGFLDELEGTGYRIDSLGGHNHRAIRGSNRLSQHAYGNAIDINPDRNPMGNRLITDLPPNVSAMAARHGLSWGGDWKRRKDAMHFEWTGRAPKKETPAAPPAEPPTSARWWRGSPGAMAYADQARQAQAAQMARISNDNRSSSSTTNSTRIGSVTVQTAATDADGIARDMEDALKRRSLAAAANYGQA